MIRSRLALKSIVYIALITFLLGCAATEKQRSTGEFVDDAAITAKVKTELIREPSLKALQINVDTYNGVVLLSGFVDSQASVKKAEEVASGVAGVKSGLLA